MTAINNVQSVLLLNQQEGTVIPYSTAAFDVADGRKSRVLQKYLGALVVYRTGLVSRIEGIQFLGYWGRNFWQRAFSFANGGTRRIALTQRSVTIPLTDVRELVVAALRRHPDVIAYFQGDEDDERDAAAMIETVAKSSTFEDLFQALGVGDPQDQLDTL